MPKFFFDFRQGAERCPDAQGLEFDSVDEAYLEAFRGAQDMWSELLRRRENPRRCVFEVRDANRDLVFIFPFQDVMDACNDREGPSMQLTFEAVCATANYAKRVSAEFQKELHELHRALHEARQLVRRADTELHSVYSRN